MLKDDGNCLIYQYDNETVRIDPWGSNAFRVRITHNAELNQNDWALNIPQTALGKVEIVEDIDRNGGKTKNYSDRSGDNSYAVITNGKLSAKMTAYGVMKFTNAQGKVILEEDWQRREDEPSLSLKKPAREFRSRQGEYFHITMRFKANKKEKIFGMGQYQQHDMDMKGCMLELAQRNSQVTIPFYISNQGYGFFWNNPGIGKVFFGKNGTEWTAESTRQADYWIVAGDTPAEIEESYMSVTGLPPMMPDYGMGFWQCKLRYRNQEELLAVARKHKKLGLPMDVIVVDYFHWTQQGEYKFDPEYWPDVEGMCRELKEMGIQVMVSVWPTVDYRSENFAEMMEKGYLVRTERGVRVTMCKYGQEVFIDPTNPGTREFVWDKVKQNYWDKGVRLFWLDEAEPEYTVYDYDNYRYYLGTDLEMGNLYPLYYAKGFFDGMKAQGMEQPMNLLRCAWAGSAKYGALVWSGDIDSTYECLQRQVKAGLSMAIAGIPWWTTDIGGFHGGDINDPGFRKLLIRWFEYGCFCPVFRLHGYRDPKSGFDGDIISGIGLYGTGAENEVWSYGEECFEIMKKYLFIRERLRFYIKEQMEKTHKTGTPIMRPLFYDFYPDERAWEIEDQYMFGPDVLVAPVVEEDRTERQVYLPAGAKWVNVWTEEAFEGGQWITAEAPLEQIPLYFKNNAKLPIKEA